MLYFKDIRPTFQTKQNKKSQSNLGRAASSPLTSENKNATKSPLVTMGCPTFTPKLPLPLRRCSAPSNTPIPRPTGIQIQSAIFPQFTHRQTDRPTGGLGDNSVPTPTHALLIVYMATRLIILCHDAVVLHIHRESKKERLYSCPYLC